MENIVIPKMVDCIIQLALVIKVVVSAFLMENYHFSRVNFSCSDVRCEIDTTVLEQRDVCGRC